jgi:hypothetical protein
MAAGAVECGGEGQPPIGATGEASNVTESAANERCGSLRNQRNIRRVHVGA